MVKIFVRFFNHLPIVAILESVCGSGDCNLVLKCIFPGLKTRNVYMYIFVYILSFMYSWTNLTFVPFNTFLHFCQFPMSIFKNASCIYTFFSSVMELRIKTYVCYFRPLMHKVWKMSTKNMNINLEFQAQSLHQTNTIWGGVLRNYLDRVTQKWPPGPPSLFHNSFLCLRTSTAYFYFLLFKISRFPAIQIFVTLALFIFYEVIG